MSTNPEGIGGTLTRGAGLAVASITLISFFVGGLFVSGVRYANVMDMQTDAAQVVAQQGDEIAELERRLDSARETLDAKLQGIQDNIVNVTGRTDRISDRIVSIEEIIKERIDVDKALFEGLTNISSQVAVSNQILSRLERSVDAIEDRRARTDQK